MPASVGAVQVVTAAGTCVQIWGRSFGGAPLVLAPSRRRRCFLSWRGVSGVAVPRVTRDNLDMCHGTSVGGVCGHRATAWVARLTDRG